MSPSISNSNTLPNSTCICTLAPRVLRLNVTAQTTFQAPYLLLITSVIGTQVTGRWYVTRQLSLSSQYAPMLQSALQRQWFQCVCGYDTYEMTLISVEYQHSIAPRYHPISVCGVFYSAVGSETTVSKKWAINWKGVAWGITLACTEENKEIYSGKTKKFTEENKEIYRGKQINLQGKTNTFTEGNKEIYRGKQRHLQREISKFREENKDIYRGKQRNLQRKNKEIYRGKQRNLQRKNKEIYSGKTKKFTAEKQRNLQRETKKFTGENKEIYSGKTKKFTEENKEIYRGKQINLQGKTNKFTEGNTEI
jgi:hypothetical protein